MIGKAAVLENVGKFGIEKREITCGPGEVLIRVAVCGLCNWEKGFFTGALPIDADSTLGHEWAGVVWETGPGVDSVKPGDKVAVLPEKLEGFAEYAVVAQERCFRLADHVDVHEGFMEPLKCVVTVLRSAAPEAGDYGVIIGCGPMGLWCVQALAGRLLAGLIAVDIDDGKLELAKKFGAVYTINSAKEDVAARVSEITGGHMADFVIEGTGIPGLIPLCAGVLKASRGRVVLMSYYERNNKEFDWRPFADKGAILLNPQPAFSEDPLDDARRAVELINNGTFRQDEIVTHKFTLDEVQEAFETIVNKPADYIKGVVICDENFG